MCDTSEKEQCNLMGNHVELILDERPSPIFQISFQCCLKGKNSKDKIGILHMSYFLDFGKISLTSNYIVHANAY